MGGQRANRWSDFVRILIAGTTYAPAANGQSVFTVNLAESLVMRSHEVVVATHALDGRESVTLRNGVTVVTPRSYGLTSLHPDAQVTLNAYRTVDRLFEQIRPQVVHLQDHYPLSWFVLWSARRRRLPVIGANHFMPDNLSPYLPYWQQLHPVYRRVAWFWMLLLYNRLDYVTVQSGFAGELLRTQGLKQPMIQISCGIDLTQFYADSTLGQADMRARFGLAPDRKLVLYLGRVDKEKRIDLLLHALHGLKRQDVQLAIAGKGAALESMWNLAAELSLGDRVRFLGYVPRQDVRPLLCCADIFAMPSPAELLSIATLEAMACGRPILAARTGALPELVKDHENGRLFRPDDAADAARVLVELVDNPQSWQQMGLNSRQRAAVHSWADALAAYESLYAGLVS